eukprot:COSAG01_NODE_52141_length_350_cov_0.432000_1_plen_61_part_01
MALRFNGHRLAFVNTHLAAHAEKVEKRNADIRNIVQEVFFKQKTAYEISECDWSSDVCSSD